MALGSSFLANMVMLFHAQQYDRQVNGYAAAKVGSVAVKVLPIHRQSPLQKTMILHCLESAGDYPFLLLRHEAVERIVDLVDRIHIGCLVGYLGWFASTGFSGKIR